MSEHVPDDEELFEESSSGPIEDRSPELHADIFVLAPKQRWRKSIVAALPDSISVQSFGTPSAFLDALSSSVAVALLSMRLPDDELERVVLQTIRDTNYTRIGLLCGDRERIRKTPIPHDEMFYKSSDLETFRNRVKRLYVRAYYDASLQRYYKLGVAAKNRRATLEEPAGDEQLGKLEASTDLMESHLRRFRQFLQPGDLEAILNRSERIERMLNDLLQGNEPTVIGLPKRCPDCHLAFDEWHGSELGPGYRKIGADTWRCTGCGAVIESGGDPENYRVR